MAYEPLELIDRLGPRWFHRRDSTRCATTACSHRGRSTVPTSCRTRLSLYIDKNGKVKFIDTKVSVRTHGTDIAATLAELGFPRRAAKD